MTRSTGSAFTAATAYASGAAHAAAAALADAKIVVLNPGGSTKHDQANGRAAPTATEAAIAAAAARTPATTAAAPRITAPRPTAAAATAAAASTATALLPLAALRSFPAALAQGPESQTRRTVAAIDAVLPSRSHATTRQITTGRRPSCRASRARRAGLGVTITRVPSVTTATTASGTPTRTPVATAGPVATGTSNRAALATRRAHHTVAPDEPGCTDSAVEARRTIANENQRVQKLEAGAVFHPQAHGARASVDGGLGLHFDMREHGPRRDPYCNHRRRPTKASDITGVIA